MVPGWTLLLACVLEVAVCDGPEAGRGAFAHEAHWSQRPRPPLTLAEASLSGVTASSRQSLERRLISSSSTTAPATNGTTEVTTSSTPAPATTDPWADLFQKTTTAKDVTAPTVKSTLPTDGANNVKTANRRIQILFSETISLVMPAEVTFKVFSTSASGTKKNVKHMLSSNSVVNGPTVGVKNMLEFLFPSNLEAGTTYELHLPNGIVKDNMGLAYIGGTVTTFTTAGATATTAAPAAPIATFKRLALSMTVGNQQAWLEKQAEAKKWLGEGIANGISQATGVKPDLVTVESIQKARRLSARRLSSAIKVTVDLRFAAGLAAPSDAKLTGSAEAEKLRASINQVLATNGQSAMSVTNLTVAIATATNDSGTGQENIAQTIGLIIAGVCAGIVVVVCAILGARCYCRQSKHQQAAAATGAKGNFFAEPVRVAPTEPSVVGKAGTSASDSDVGSPWNSGRVGPRAAGQPDLSKSPGGGSGAMPDARRPDAQRAKSTPLRPFNHQMGGDRAKSAEAEDVKRPQAMPKKMPKRSGSFCDDSQVFGDWVQDVDPDSGKTFWFNPKTRQRRWEKPPGVGRAAPSMTPPNARNRPPPPRGFAEGPPPGSADQPPPGSAPGGSRPVAPSGHEKAYESINMSKLEGAEEVASIKADVLKQLQSSHKDDLPLKKKTFRFLCLRWHPDKNADQEDLAKQVFQFLQDQRSWYLEEE